MDATVADAKSRELDAKSRELYAEAVTLIPGGVNSPVRAMLSVGRTPLFIRKARGPFIYDADGNRYIDYVCSWGPMILGHARPEVIQAVRETAGSGLSFGAPCELESALARLIIESYPSVELVRMVNSGTEAAMSAVRVARGFTRRNLILKFEGCYHGHSDGLLVKAGSGALTTAVPDSAGVPEAFARTTVSATYNDFEGTAKIVEAHSDDLAAILVEPVAANMGVVPPAEGFLGHLRELADRTGALLIFDEVITGFRLGPSGAQGLYGVRPDLTVFGKIIGGGMPVGAYGGRRQIMEMVSPLGPVYQAGTLAGNPVAMAAGAATLRLLKAEPHLYQDIDRAAAALEQGLNEAAHRHGIPLRVNRVGSLLSAFFTASPEVRDLRAASTSDRTSFARFFNEMLARGVYLAPSQFEAWFVSAAHTETVIAQTVKTIDGALSAMSRTP